MSLTSQQIKQTNIMLAREFINERLDHKAYTEQNVIRLAHFIEDIEALPIDSSVDS